MMDWCLLSELVSKFDWKSFGLSTSSARSVNGQQCIMATTMPTDVEIVVFVHQHQHKLNARYEYISQVQFMNVPHGVGHT